MSDNTDPQPVIAAPTHALIASSPRLRQMVFPEGFLSSPYEVLDYESIVILHDPSGREATLWRTQKIRFLQNGIRGILDHAWGDGVVLTSYKNGAGYIADSFRDGGRRHIIVELPRPRARGEVMDFGVERTVRLAFTRKDEWLETNVDHPVSHIRCTVMFPPQRSCQRANFLLTGSIIDLPIRRLADGRTVVQLEVPKPVARTPYKIDWSW